MNQIKETREFVGGYNWDLKEKSPDKYYYIGTKKTTMIL